VAARIAVSARPANAGARAIFRASVQRLSTAAYLTTAMTRTSLVSVVVAET